MLAREGSCREQSITNFVDLIFGSSFRQVKDYILVLLDDESQYFEVTLGQNLARCYSGTSIDGSNTTSSHVWVI